VDFACSVSTSGQIDWLGSFPAERVAGTDYRLDLAEGKLVVKDSLNKIAGRFPDDSEDIESKGYA
jgi:hypothetical protein